MKGIYFLFILSLFSFFSYSQNYEIYVSDAGNFNNPPWQILKFAADGSNPQVFINTNLGWPQDILFLENQNEVLISNLTTNTINRHDASNGQFINNFATGISGPTRMKIGADSLLYVLQWSGSGKVWRYDLGGNFIDEFTNTGVPSAIGLDWDNSGNLYVSSYTTHQVHKFDTSGNFVEVFINANLNGPVNIWFDNNELFVLEYNAGNVKRFDSTGNFISTFISGLNAPEGVAFTPSGNILIGDGGTSSVKEFLPGGTLVGTLIATGSGNLIQPNAVVLRNIATSSVSELTLKKVSVKPTAGNLFFIDGNNNFISYIKVYNIIGKQIAEKYNCKEWTWNAENYTEGLYLIHITLKSGISFYEKVIIQR